MKKLDQLIINYEEYHQNSTNRLIHFVCVPLIALSLMGLLWCVKIPTPWNEQLPFTPNAGVLFIFLTMVYYASLSIGCLVGMLVFGLVTSVLCISLDASPASLLAVSVCVFGLAWVGQFVGHRIEGKRPAFVDDLEFLLVSPAWLLDCLFKRPWMGTAIILMSMAVTFLLADLLFSMKPITDFSHSIHRAKDYDVQIARDTWGIPHILGKTNADVAHGLAYAHAEDDFQTIQDVLLGVRGKLASVRGMQIVYNDYYVHLAGIWNGLEDKYAKLSPELKAICQAYTDGLNLYASRHPEKLDRNLWPSRPEDLVAGFIHKMPLMFGLDRTVRNLMKSANKSQTLANVLKPDDLPTGSNFIAVGPRRSEDQATYVCLNSHQPWTGPVTWYEAHLVSEEGSNIYGGLFPGSPVILIGHNENIAWGHTVNSPDLVDVFELEINPQNPDQYRVDGRWKDLNKRYAPIEIKLWWNFRWTFKREILHSIHGPAIRLDDKIYAISYAGKNRFRQIEQWFRMGQAKDLEQFKEAMRIHAIAMFNTGYADKDGNLFYVYNALMPERVAGYDWSGTVTGNTSSNLWSTYLQFDKLPQVENPKSGFIQNCNSSPFRTTTGDDNPDELDYSEDFGIEKKMTNRALRAVELYGSDTSITLDEFMKYKYDKTYSPKSQLLQQVNVFLKHHTDTEGTLQDGLELLRMWDGTFNTDNRSAALVMLTFRPRSNTEKKTYDHRQVNRQLKESMEHLKEHFGRIDVKWGEVNRLIHGDKNLPLGGGSDTLRAIYGQLQDNGQLKGIAGDCFFQFVEWDKVGNLQAWAIHQFGSNTGDPDAIHFSDQAQLFANEKMRKILFTEEEVRAKAKRIYKP